MPDSLPDDVVAADRELENAEQDAVILLAQHRWHWTLDRGNPGRVSVLAYAKAVGRNESTIRAYAKGYADWDVRHDPAEPVSEYIMQARMSPDTVAATSAVAAARDITPGTAARAHQPETRRVRELARQAATEHGTSVAVEAPRIAARLAKAEEAAVSPRRRGPDPRVYDIAQHLLRARREILTALDIIVAMPRITPSVQQYLLTVTTNLRAALDLVDTRLSGKPGPDWDAELTRITDFRIADSLPG